VELDFVFAGGPHNKIHGKIFRHAGRFLFIFFIVFHCSQEQGSSTEVICGRFPNLTFCGCTIPCRKSMRQAKMVEVVQNLYVGTWRFRQKQNNKHKKFGTTNLMNSRNNRSYRMRLP